MRKLLFKSLLQSPLTEPASADERALAELGTNLQRHARRRLGRSLSIREVDAGSCNGCELEIHALGNAFYDLERFGLRFVASPRHADVLLVTGPVTKNMREALERTYEATPNPKWVVAVGDCAINCGVFAESYACAGPVSAVIPVDFECSRLSAGAASTFSRAWWHCWIAQTVGTQPRDNGDAKPQYLVNKDGRSSLVFLECGQRGEWPSCRSSSSFTATSALWRHCYGAAVTEGDERFGHWVPAPGQIVRIKPGFKGSIEERAFKRASEEGGPKLKLDEKALYEVVKYELEFRTAFL